MSRSRTLTMTVHSIEGHLMDATPFGAQPGSQYVMGYITVTAFAGSERHQWTMPQGERCWIGDTIEVTIVEDDPVPEHRSTPLPPQTSDRRRHRG